MNDSLMHWEFALRIAIGSTLLLILYWIARVGPLRRRSAASKYYLGILACFALILLPFLVGVSPAIRLGLLSASAIEETLAPRDANRDNGLSLSANIRVSEASDQNIGVQSATGIGRIVDNHQSTDFLSSKSPDPRGEGASYVLPNTEGSELPMERAFALAWRMLLIIYWSVVTLGLVRLFLAHRQAHRLAKGAMEFRVGMTTQWVTELIQSFKVNQSVQIRLSEEIPVPAITRLSHPVILLPRESENWPIDRFKAAIAHELAHIERNDLWSQLLCQLIAVLYWPQPLMRLLIKAMNDDRESACDDRALAFCDRPSQYARHLLEVAEDYQNSTPIGHTAALAMARSSSVEQRIKAILSSTKDRLPPNRPWLLRMLLIAMAASVCISVVSPFTIGNAQSLADDKPATESESDASRKSHSLRGRVLRPDGSPAAGAIVRSQGIGRFLQPKETKTDRDGTYSLSLPAQAFYPPLIAELDEWLGFVDVPIVQDESDEAKQRTIADLRLDVPKQVTVRVTDQYDFPAADASVIVQSQHAIYRMLRTDRQGTAKIAYPKGLPLETIGVVKPDIGCDYRAFEQIHLAVDKSHPNKLPQGFEGNLDLVLDGVRPAGVKILDPKGMPLAGVKLDPWLIKKPNRGADWNLPGLEEFSSTTNEDGTAEFYVIPLDQEKGIQIWPQLERSDWFVIGNSKIFDNGSALILWEHGNTATIHVAEKIKVGGRVLSADGTPRANVKIAAAGGFYYTGWINERSKTDANGKWEMLVKPNGYYLFVVEDDQFAAPAHSGVTILETGPQDLDFRLEPARRIYGRVTGPVDANTQVMIQQKARDYYQLPADERRLTPIENNAVSAFTQISKHVAQDGTFEFKVGPGDFVIWSPDGKTQEFTITDETEREFSFKLTGPLRGPLTVNVVSSDGRKEAAKGAIIVGRGADDPGRGFFDAVTDQSGKAQIECDRVARVLYVTSADGTMSAVSRIAAEDSVATVRLSPASSVTGRLVDSKGVALLEAQIELGFQLTYADGQMSNVITKKTTTDKTGRFKFTGIATGEDHVLSLVTGKNADGNANGWRRIAVVVNVTEPVENLGDLPVPDANARRSQKTPAELAEEAFNADTPLQRRYNDASREAKENGQQLLIVVGSAKRRDAQSLFSTLKDIDVRREFASFKLLPIDISGPQSDLNRKFLAILLQREVSATDTELILLNTDRQVVATALVSDLASGEQTLHRSLMEFATKHAKVTPRVLKLIVKDGNGEPIPGVNVYRNHCFEFEKDKVNIENANYLTDATGVADVSLSGRTTDLRIWIGKDGYLPLFLMWANKFQSDGEKVPTVFTLEMEKGMTIGGTVLDSTGQPVANAIVDVEDLTVGTAWGAPGQPGNRPVRERLLAFGSEEIITDKDGRWKLNNVPTDEQLDPNGTLRADQILSIKIKLPGKDKDRNGGLRQKDFTLASLRDQTARFVVPPQRER